MRTFNQKKLFENREFKITTSKLFYTISKFGDGNEIDIPYETLDGTKVSFKSSNGLSLCMAIVLYAVGIMTHISSLNYGENRDPFLALLWFTLGTLLLVVYIVSRKEFWKIKISNNSYLYIHKKIPSEEKVNQFLDELIIARNIHLKDNYAVIDEHLNYENQLSNFRWLKSIDALSKEEYEQKYAELKQTVKPDKANIGFGN